MKLRISYFLIILLIAGSCSNYEKDDTTALPQRYLKVPKGKIIKTEIYDTISLDARQAGTIVYKWESTNTYPYAKISNPDSSLVVVRDTGTYTIIFNIGQDSSKIIVYSVPKCFVPNSFTPDNTGPVENNVWTPVVMNIISYNLKIFSQDNLKLFESSNFNQMGWQIGWNGMYNGKLCPVGYYYYYLKYTSFIGNEYIKTGYFQLLN